MVDSCKSRLARLLLKLVGVASWPTRGRNLLALLRIGVLGAMVLSTFAADARSQTAAPAGYRIVNGDVLQVEVVGRSDVSGQFPVDKDGSITLPVLGSISASGRTTSEVGTDISRR